MDRLATIAPSTFSLLAQFSMMSWNTSCVDNCSGHGECHNGTCICEIQFEGEECRTTNVSYFVGFASVYFTLALVCSIQLVMCIVAEYQRMKGASLLIACRVTTQKLLYFVVFLACILRGTYFTSPTAYSGGCSSSLMNAYYPLLLSGSSLVVCFWAEVFHLRDVRWEKPQFLSKSFLAFVTFNFIAYSLLLVEFIAVRYSDPSPELKNFYKHFFNGCYAVLLFIVVIFFLIYGFQVFFKIEGGFLNEGEQSIQGSNVTRSETRQLVGNARNLPYFKHIDTSQLQQSRLGLLSQALMLSIIVVFLCSETLSEFWKKKVPQHSRNWHDLLFRVVEIGVALWFPCVLWNCMSPEQLWILNPKRIIKKLDMEVSHAGSSAQENRLDTSTGDDDNNQCYMCYYGELSEKGPLIKPCQCRGDVSNVHPDCLRKWLMERAENKLELSCGVCGSLYRIERVAGKVNWRTAITRKHWFQIVSIVTTMCVFGVGCLVIFRMFLDPVIQLSAVLTTLLIEYVCINCLSQNWNVLCERAKISAIKIVGVNLSTISDNVAIEIPQPSCANFLATSHNGNITTVGWCLH